MIRQGSASLEARVYNELREALLCGQFKKGESLTEHMLTERLGVSRTPVRSALQRLAEDGLVSLIPNRGAVVIGIAKEDIVDIYRIRMRLEGLASAMAAEKMTDEEIAATISKLMAFASDPEVKAIVMCQAVPGASAGFNKIREMRDDILLIMGVPQEDPKTSCAAADFLLYADEIGQGDTIIETVAGWECDIFVHYSFFFTHIHHRQHFFAAHGGVFISATQHASKHFY